MEQDKPRDQDWTPAWLERVRRRVQRWCATGAGTTWVVAVSGGGDSVGLVRALHRLAPELGLTLSVAHLDHGTRGEAARADAAFVARSGGLARSAAGSRPVAADARRALRSRCSSRPIFLAAGDCRRSRRLGHCGRTHTRRSGRDDPAPDHPRYRAAGPGGHATAARLELRSACHPHPPVALGLTAGDPHKPGDRWGRVFGRMPATPTRRGPGRGFATTSSPGWPRNTIPALPRRSFGWACWLEPPNGPWSDT